jgi:hypothetical protein
MERDGLGLAAGLGIDAGMAPGVSWGHHRQAEAIGQIHQPLGLTVAFGPGPAKLCWTREVVSILLAITTWSGAEAAEPTLDRVIVGEMRSPARGHSSTSAPT